MPWWAWAIAFAGVLVDDLVVRRLAFWQRRLIEQQERKIDALRSALVQVHECHPRGNDDICVCGVVLASLSPLHYGEGDQ